MLILQFISYETLLHVLGCLTSVIQRAVSDSKSMCLRPAASASPGSLLEMHVLGSHIRPTESEALGWHTPNSHQQCVFSQALHLILTPAKV